MRWRWPLCSGRVPFPDAQGKPLFPAKWIIVNSSPMEPVSFELGIKSAIFASVIESLLSSPTYPMPDQFVFRHGRGAGLEDPYQATSLQQPNSILHCGFGKACPFRELLQTQCNPFLFLAIQRSPKDNVKQKRCRRAIVTGQIRQKHIDNVFVNRICCIAL